ncbi:phosphatidylinositol 3 (ataxia telangiectasia mutated) [Zalerion maritima]|uniref:Serine/threonine-protein kinase Tel1 n=1 Tax=Zalerion maritima TaxID=339359 RepID=A0AAD5WVN4_9PEZI|nr:phosphatidylinositol 3 (ataxia telangiectasia mutated) [Zalerion maritima]
MVRPRSLEEALSALSSGTQTDRHRGLTVFIELFERRGKSPELSSLDNKSYQRILQTLFSLSLAEKRVFFSVGARRGGKTPNSTWLETSGEAIRLVAIHGCTKFKRNTLWALVDHVTDTLPGPDDNYVEPLLQSYVKALAAVLAYPPNVEVLASKDADRWLVCVNFCIQALTRYAESSDREPASRASPAPGTLPSTGRSSSSAQRSGAGKIHSATYSELLRCFICLASGTNAPLTKKAKEMSSIAMRLLRGHTAMAQLFGVINFILAGIQADDVGLAGRLSRQLVPEVIRWWQSPNVNKEKDASTKAVKDEITRSIFFIHLHLSQQTSEPGNESVLNDVRDLADALRTEYARRDSVARLQLGDLVFSSPHLPSYHLQATAFALNRHSSEGERRWGFVQALALLEGIIYDASKFVAPERQGEQPRKRRKVSAPKFRILDGLLMRDFNAQITSMQLVPFFLTNTTVSRAELLHLVDALASLVGNKDSGISNWAMLALSSCAIKLKGDDLNEPTWRSIWQVTVRLISMPQTSRAACVLLSAILEASALPFNTVSDDINNIVTTSDTNGPAVLVDSSIALMHHVLYLRNTHLPNASQMTSHDIIRWVFSKWNPVETTYSSSQSPFVIPTDISALLSMCCGCLPYETAAPLPVTGGIVAQGWKTMVESESMMRYLLLLKEAPIRHFCWSQSGKEMAKKTILQVSDISNFHSAKKLALELVFPKLEEVLTLAEGWANRDKRETSSQITVERFQCQISFCATCSLMIVGLQEVSSRQSQDLEPVYTRTIEALINAVLGSSGNQKFFAAIHQCIRPVLPDVSTTSLTQLSKDAPLLSRLIIELSNALYHKVDNRSSGPDVDFMDLDDEFDSQASHLSTAAQDSDVPRTKTAMALSIDAFFSSTSLRLHFMAAIATDPSQAGLVPTEFLDHVLSLADGEFVAGSSFLIELLEGDVVVNPDDGARLLEKQAGIIGRAGFIYSEAALSNCLALIRCLSAAGSDEKHELHALITQLYSHFIETALPANSLSVPAQIDLAGTVFFFLGVGSDYSRRGGESAYQDCLLKMVEESPMPIKHFIGRSLPDLFALYVLKEHDEIFVNYLEALPVDPDFAEGIAFRLFALSEIGCRWPNLLRRCIYHIFETPGSVPESSKYATRCLSKISTALGLSQTKELFHLFAPQLLYTWLEDCDLGDIPYEIFGYQNISDLLCDAKEEAAALMIMREQDDKLMALVESLKMTPAGLINKAFAKIMAYSIAHDLSGSNHDPHTMAESRLKKILGKERFTELLYVNFADILGFLFQTYDDSDDPIKVQRYFSKNECTGRALETLSEIYDLCHSDGSTPQSQQPTFKGRYLPKHLLYLTARTKWDLDAIWTPALVVAISRRLFNTIDHALGSLHACVVIRRLRIVISLAGGVAYSPYPLEMLLHSLRPYLVDSECADDALGMSEYLLRRGYEHLQRSPSFLAGYALSALASLRVFLDSGQSSTTQESQFKATKDKARAFHVWFTKYLASYSSPSFKDESLKEAFETITTSAAHIRSSGNADKGTHESKLLLEILADGEREHKLLNDSARQLALRMLCGDFHIPESSRTDIVESDREALRFGAVVWNSCRATSLSENYLSWAGRVVGKSFAASGEIYSQILRESGLNHHAQEGSEFALLSLLRELTMSSESRIAGLAESTLRLIITSAERADDKNFLGMSQESLHEPLHVASFWGEFEIPPSDNAVMIPVSEVAVFAKDHIKENSWASSLGTYLAQLVSDNVILQAIAPVVARVEGFARQALPFIIHLVLLLQHKKQSEARRTLSSALKDWLAETPPSAKNNTKLMVDTVMYLRTQPIPGESCIAERMLWLDLDLSQVSVVAAACDMFKTALLLAELSVTELSRISRRSSAQRAVDPSQILLDIYQNIDDPDAYYGLPQDPSLSGVLARLEYEGDGSKSLAFRGAQLDSHIRLRDRASKEDSESLVKSLGNLGLAGLSNSLLQTQQGTASSDLLEDTFTTARRLEVWNLPAPVSNDNYAVSLYTVYQGVYQGRNMQEARKAIHSGLGRTMESLTSKGQHVSTLRRKLGALAAMSELDDILSASDPQDLDDVLGVFDARGSWMRRGRYDDVSQILSSRVTALSMLERQSQQPNLSKLRLADTRVGNIRSMMLSSKILRFHEATQESLNLATSLTHLIKPSENLGLAVEAAINIEVTNALWDQGEMIPSIRLLQLTEKKTSFKKQTIRASKSALLATTAYRISVARLEKPDRIQKNYLEPALKELKGANEGKEAGQVYHQFATFCDEQLQNPDGLEDLARLRSLKKGKSDEVAQLRSLISSTRDAQQKTKYTKHLSHARQWLGLDEQELLRVEQTRAEFVRQSLENYLLSLAASDEYNNDALRFTALWMEQAGESLANDAARQHLDKVPTRKFAALMNQLTSRLLDQQTMFQKCLTSLIIGICTDHPFHGMHQIWAATKTRPNQSDDIAISRQHASVKVAHNLAKTRKVAHTWHAVDRTNAYYHRLAAEQDKELYTSGRKVAMAKSTAGSQLMSALSKYQLPPCTIQLELSPTCDYSNAPVITKLEPTMSIASGISAPKIITAIGTDGKRYKQLVKGGNDDLRQDAIMEQVFSSVSSVLSLHRTTQQRNLSIRTYKVLPLTSSSGVIEFVSNTIPLHEYLMPAHEKYFPRDYKSGQCRKEIHAMQNKSIETKLSAYKKVAERFHPVMRYFFLEHFEDPDDWYVRRLAYTRSTAAVSIVGHVIGLGDRHGHNILLDTKSGESVHIDLGVCFEQGRILPVPEVIPFRLTRDIVDGMGITGTEGVFRRCCEFTLDALRKEQYSIMTVLDVLRHDPLYSWSVSPVRLAKLQAAHDGDDGDGEVEGRIEKDTATNEPSEADRALEVVRKKLSKTLSVNATVNDLINQATDERNLAVLYSGWAAYA